MNSRKKSVGTIATCRGLGGDYSHAVAGNYSDKPGTKELVQLKPPLHIAVQT